MKQKRELEEAQRHLEALETNLADFQKKREFDLEAWQVLLYSTILL